MCCRCNNKRKNQARILLYGILMNLLEGFATIC